MATVYDAAARRKLQARIDALTPDLKPRWGRMNVGQMIVHCDLHLRHSLGEHLTPVGKPIKYFPLNLLIIYLLPTPKGVPTMDELGLKGFASVEWYGLLGPAGLQQAVVAKWSQALAKAAQDKSTVDLINATGCDVEILSPAQTVGKVNADNAKWGKVVKDAAIKAE